MSFISTFAYNIRAKWNSFWSPFKSFASYIGTALYNFYHKVVTTLYHVNEFIREKTTNITPLMDAAMHGDPELVASLLEKGADANATDIFGEHALSYAIFSCKIENAKILLPKTTDVNKKYYYDKTLLMLAARYGDPELISSLLARGADANAVDNDGSNALCEAIATGNVENAKILLPKTTDVNKKYYSGDTLLMLAAKKGDSELVSNLLEKVIDPSVHGIRIGNETIKLNKGASDYEIERFMAARGNMTAIELHHAAVAANFNFTPDAYDTLVTCFSDFLTAATFLVPVCVRVEIAGKPEARTYEYAHMAKVIAGEYTGHNDIDPAASSVRIRDPETRQVIGTKANPPKLIVPKILMDLVDYLRLEVPPKSINDFPGFINPATGHRYKNPRLTTDGNIVEAEPTDASLMRLPVLENLMREFPVIVYKGRVTYATAVDYERDGNKLLALVFAFKAFDQASFERDKVTANAASDMIYTIAELPAPKPKKYPQISSMPQCAMQLNQAEKVLLTKNSIEKKLRELFLKIYGEENGTRIFNDFIKHLEDPISHAIIFDPVLIESGNTMCALQARQHFERCPNPNHTTDPTTRTSVDPNMQIENLNFAQIIPYMLLNAERLIREGLSAIPMLCGNDKKLLQVPYTADGKTMFEGCPKDNSKRYYRDLRLGSMIEFIRRHESKAESSPDVRQYPFRN